MEAYSKYTIYIITFRFDINENFDTVLLDVSTLQRPVLILELSTPQGPELHLDVSTIQMPVLLLGVFTPQWPELHLDLSTQQRPLLLLDLSTPRVLSCTWTWLDNSSRAAPGRVHTTGA